MPTTLNRTAYEKLIAEDLEWLLAQPRSLEREHIEAIVRRSADHEYGGATSADHLVRAVALIAAMSPAERDAFFASHPETTAYLGLSIPPDRKHRVLTVPDSALKEAEEAKVARKRMSPAEAIRRRRAQR